MKNLFLPAMFCLTMMFGFTACGNDDEDILDVDDPTDVVISNGWTEEGNKLVYTLKTDAMTMTWTILFDESDLCSSSKCTCTYASSEVASAVYEAWKESYGNKVTKSGKSIRRTSKNVCIYA